MSWEYHWQWWQRMTTPPEPPPVPVEDVSPWEIEKSHNRLRRAVEKVESGRWLPRVAYQLSGSAQRELKEARALLDEAGQARGRT